MAEREKSKKTATAETNEPQGDARQAEKQQIRGIVVSDKMNKTRVVEVRRRLKHSFYHKMITRRTRLFVHDEANISKTGDLIRAESTRPLSKNKNFRLVEVLTVAAASGTPDAKDALV